MGLDLVGVMFKWGGSPRGETRSGSVRDGVECLLFFLADSALPGIDSVDFLGVTARSKSRETNMEHRRSYASHSTG